MHRRQLLTRLCALWSTVPLAALATNPSPTRPLMEVWKTASCGCCKDWVKHVQSAGFEVKTYDVSDDAKRKKRQQLGLPEAYGSCHTALVDGYVLEGHVPARDIKRLLMERPVALGLAVPAMPIGSPGMDGPEYGGRRDKYAVLLVQRNGGPSIYQQYP
jgi:hypothetical protein